MNDPDGRTLNRKVPSSLAGGFPGTDLFNPQKSSYYDGGTTMKQLAGAPTSGETRWHNRRDRPERLYLRSDRILGRTLRAARAGPQREDRRRQSRFGSYHAERPATRSRLAASAITDRFGCSSARPQRGSTVWPISALSTAWAAWRPSRIAQTTRLWPRRMSPHAQTLSTEDA
jgi:hypothetical protein